MFQLEDEQNRIDVNDSKAYINCLSDYFIDNDVKNSNDLLLTHLTQSELIELQTYFSSDIGSAQINDIENYTSKIDGDSWSNTLELKLVEPPLAFYNTDIGSKFVFYLSNGGLSENFSLYALSCTRFLAVNH